MAKDLRNYLAWLAKEYPEEFVEVKEVIDPAHHEVAAYLKVMEDKGRLPVTLFQKVKNQKGEPSEFPLVYNLFATRPLCAMAIGLKPSDYRMGLVTSFGDIQKKPVDYEVIEPNHAPVMENIWRGEDADVTRLPAARYHEKDVAPYFVMASVFKGKSGDFYNVTMTKNMVKGPRKISVSASAHHDLARILSEYEAASEPTPALVVLGHHPAFYFGCCAMTPYGNDDYRTAGGYLAEPLRVVPSASLGKEILIPADAEIVIEGLVPPGVREIQNPFGEISGHYQPPQMYPVIDVKAICFRDNALMQGNVAAHTEHINLGAISKEGSVFNAIKRVMPEIKAISLPNSGCGRFSCYISVEKKTFRDVQVAAMTAFAEMPNAKLVVVVDEEINVFNETEVMWAVTTQTRWDKDVSVIPRVQSFRSWLGDAVAIIDATRPEDVSDFPERNRMSEDVINQIRNRFGI